MERKSIELGKILYILTAILILYNFQKRISSIDIDFFIFFSMYLFYIPLIMYMLKRPLNLILIALFSFLFYYKLYYNLNVELYKSVIITIFINLVLFLIFLSKSSMAKLHEYKLSSIKKTQEVTLQILGKVSEVNNEETSGHLNRVQNIVKILAQELQKIPMYAQYIDTRYIQDLVSASTLHDIGKIGIPDHILNKEGPLNEEERDIMKTHTLVGHKLLSEAKDELSISSVYDLATEMARSHHERWDGSGYPDRLTGTSIPLSARIMALADVYDALLSKRPYKKAYSHVDSLNIIRKGAGTHFDPVLVKYFMKVSNQIEALYFKDEITAPFENVI